MFGRRLISLFSRSSGLALCNRVRTRLESACWPADPRPLQQAVSLPVRGAAQAVEDLGELRQGAGHSPVARRSSRRPPRRIRGPSRAPARAHSRTKVHAAPLPARPARHLAERQLQPSCASETTRGTPRRPRRTRLRRNAVQTAPSPTPPHRRRARRFLVGKRPNRHGHHVTDNTSTDLHSVVRRIRAPVGVRSNCRVRNGSITASSCWHIRATCDFDIPSSPTALISRLPSASPPVDAGLLHDGTQRLSGPAPHRTSDTRTSRRALTPEMLPGRGRGQVPRLRRIASQRV